MPQRTIGSPGRRTAHVPDAPTETGKVIYIDAETGEIVGTSGEQSSSAAPAPHSPERQLPVKIPTSFADVADTAPEQIPAFSVVAATVDRYMSRLPWWVVAGGTAAGVWYVMRKRV